MQIFEIIYKGIGTLETIKADRMQTAYKELRLMLTLRGKSLTEQLDYKLERL